MTRQILVDSHNHTYHSHDAVSKIENLCAVAKSKGLWGIAVTDHADVQYNNENNGMEHIRASVRETRAMASRLEGELCVLSGLEIGESVWDVDYSHALIDSLSPDVVLGSVHSVRYKDRDRSFSTIDFTEWSEALLDDYMKQYFEDMYEMVEKVDMDILTHLNNPLKYINGKFCHRIGCSPYGDRIRDILKTVIRRGIALEVNTALVGSSYSILMPETDVIATYKALGGERVSIGSDSHREADVGRNLDYALSVLKATGFDRYCYFKNRQCTFVDIKGE